MICSLLSGKLYIHPYCVLADAPPEQLVLPDQQMVVPADKMRKPLIWPMPVTCVSVEVVACRLLGEMVMGAASDPSWRLDTLFQPLIFQSQMP